MSAPPAPLEQTRQRLLRGLRDVHAIAKSAETALELARGEWICGEYESALAHFHEAFVRAPHDARCALSLARAASMMGRDDLEHLAIPVDASAFPTSAEIALHSALRALADDPPGARNILTKFAQHPACKLYLEALDCLLDQHLPHERRTSDPRQDAAWNGFVWLQRHASGVNYVGLPADVLNTAVRAARQDGLWMECGVYFGRSINLIARYRSGTVHGFDSFQGLPEAWKPGEAAGAYSTDGRLPTVASNVQLHQGWFQDTLPRFLACQGEAVSLLHVDCDLYSSTQTVLGCLRARIHPGTVLIFDDFLGYPGFEQHEMRAFVECVDDTGLRWEVLSACLLGREVAFRIID